MPSPRRFIRGLSLLLSLILPGCVLVPTLTGPPPELEPAPVVAPPPAGRVLRGVVHCHSDRSHDATGSPERIVGAALEAGLSFVALTDHYRPPGLVPDLTGERDGVILISGAELRAHGGSALGVDLKRPLEGETPPGAQARLDWIRDAGGLALIGHAEGFGLWEVERYDGLEVANLHAMAEAAWIPGTVFAALLYPPGPFFRRLVRHVDLAVLARWDDLGRARRVPGFGGCDAHEGIRLLGPIAGTVGTYVECARAVSTHLIVREEGVAGVREALAAGRGYVAFEIAGSAMGFRFALTDASGAVLAEMGEEARFRHGLVLRAAAPGRAELRIVRDGELVIRGEGRVELRPTRPGVYRVEAWRGDDPFVLSNPIYLRASSADPVGRAP